MATNTRPELTAEPRDVTGKKVARLRREGKLPGVVFGHGHESESVQVDARAFEQLRRKVGRNALVDLHVGNGQARPVLVHGVQENPVTRRPVHVDFFLVRMTEELIVEVPIHTTGVAEAAEKLGGTLLHPIDRVRVRALPGDLPQAFEIDITPLKTFDDVLHVSDLDIPAGVTLLTEPSELIARVQPPRVEEEPEAPAAEAVEGAEAAGEEPGAPTEAGESSAAERQEQSEPS